MRRITLEELPPPLAELMVAAQRERIVVTRDGQPYALLVGMENKDLEDLELEFSPSFWRMIEESRRSKISIPLEEVKAELEAEEQRIREQDAGAPPEKCDAPA